MTTQPRTTTSSSTTSSRSTGDLIATIILLVVQLAVSFVLLVMTVAAVAVMGEMCAANTACSVAQIETGAWIELIVSAVALIAAVVFAVIRLVRAQRAYWIPLVGLGVTAIGWIVGYLISSGGVA